MTTRHLSFSSIASRIVAGGLVALFVAPSMTLAASSNAPARATNAKAVSLVLADVRHVLGRELTAGNARYSTPSAMGACTSTPPVKDYTADFYGPLRTKGVLNVISDVYTYKSAAGPVCNQKLDASTYKILGGTLGKLSTVHGVGEQAFVVDTTGPKTKLAPVYTLGLKFTRGLYRAIIIVQSNKKIRESDMVRLGQIVDARMKRTH
jgi:hypothetical protein